MATDAEKEVIKEFLVQLGFKVDPVSARRFNDALHGAARGALQAGAAVVAVAAAAQAMVTVFATGMEKMFYASKRTRSSVENLKALEFAFEKIGLEGNTALAVVESFSRGLRLNPGLTALLGQFGVKTTGDQVEMLRDLVSKLAGMPHHIGAQYANMFGIPEDVFLQWKLFPELAEAAFDKMIRMQRESGLNMGAAARAARDYMNIIRELWERVTLLGNYIASKMLPYFREFNAWAVKAVRSLQLWVASITAADIKEFTDAIVLLKDGIVALGNVFAALFAHRDQFAWFFRSLGAVITNTTGALAALLGALTALGEGRFADAWGRLKEAGYELLREPGTPLPPGGPLEGARGWLTDQMEGAAGLFDPSAYRFGRGLRPLGAGAGAGASTTININAPQKTDIKIDGSGSPEAAGRAVGREQGRVNADLVRNLAGAVR